MWSAEEATEFFTERAPCAVPAGADDAEIERRQRLRGVKLAEAERVLRSGPYFIEVVTDPDGFVGDVEYDGPVYIVTLFDATDDVRPRLADSLGGVCAESENDDYIRLVSAELMEEYLEAMR